MFARLKAIPTLDLPEMRSSRLILRPLLAADAARVYAAIDHSRGEFTRWFTWAHDATLLSARQNLQEGHMAMIAGSEWHYGIFDRVQCFCGRISLSEIDHKAHRAELGYWLDTEVHGQGIMTEAVRLVLAMVLSSSHHLKIDAYTDVENAASQRVLKKCGFRNVGSIVNAVNHPQRGWRDQYHFTLISDGR